MKKLILAVLLSITLTSVFAQKENIITIYPDVVYHHKDGMALTMDIYMPSNHNSRGVIFINSGGFYSPFFSNQYKKNSNSLSEVNKNNFVFIPKVDLKPEFHQQFSFEELLKSGFTVFDVRHSSTPKYMLDEITTDLNFAISYIKKYAKKYKISKDRLGVCGGSAGGYLAAYLAANPQGDNNFKAVVLYYPAGYDFLHSRNDMARKALPSLNTSEQTLDSLSLKHYISNKMPPTIILYGALDNPFIIEPSEILIREFKNKNVECEKIVFDKIGHIWMDENRKYSNKTGDKAMSKLIDWFNMNL